MSSKVGTRKVPVADQEWVVYLGERLLLKKVISYVARFTDKFNLCVSPELGLSIRVMDTSRTGYLYARLFQRGFLACEWRMATPAEFVVGVSTKSWLQILDGASNKQHQHVELHISPDSDNVLIHTLKCLDPELLLQTPRQKRLGNEQLWELKQEATRKTLDITDTVPNLPMSNPALMALVSSRVLTLEFDKTVRESGVQVQFHFSGQLSTQSEDLRAKLQRGVNGARAPAAQVYHTDEIMIRVEYSDGNTDSHLYLQPKLHDLHPPLAAPSGQTDAWQRPQSAVASEDVEPTPAAVIAALDHVSDPFVRSGATEPAPVAPVYLAGTPGGMAGTPGSAVLNNNNGGGGAANAGGHVLVTADRGVVITEQPHIMKDCKAMCFAPKLLHEVIRGGDDLSDTASLSFFPGTGATDPELIVVGYDMGEQGTVIAAVASLINMD